MVDRSPDDCSANGSTVSGLLFQPMAARFLNFSTNSGTVYPQNDGPVSLWLISTLLGGIGYYSTYSTLSVIDCRLVINAALSTYKACNRLCRNINELNTTTLSFSRCRLQVCDKWGINASTNSAWRRFMGWGLRALICKTLRSPWNRLQVIDSASLCSLAGRYSK